MPSSKPPVLPEDLSGAVPISAQIPVRVFPCFRPRDPGAPPLIDLSRVVLSASRKSFVGLDRYAAGDLLRPILAEFGLRGGAELTSRLRLAETSEREAVGSHSFQRAVGTHVVLEHALHQLRAHLKVVDETFVLLPAPTAATITTTTTPLLGATTATTVTAAAAASPAVGVAAQNLARSSPLSSSGSQVVGAIRGRTATTPETTSEGATVDPAQQPTVVALQEEVKEEPSGAKASLLLDHSHHSIREVDHIAADGYGYDYVMVFKTEEAGVITEFADKAVRQIIAAGLTVRVYFSISGRDIFCEMRAPVERLRQFADQVRRRLLLDEFELAKAAVAGDPEANIAPIRINDDPNISFRSPYEFIYARYDRTQHLQNLYSKSDDLSHPFRSVVRLSLVVDILKTPMFLGGAGLKVDRLQFEGKIEALFPKHFEQNKSRLRDKWLVLRQWPWDAPYDDIKEYYGEKIGLYFHFLGHLTTWLLPLAVAGLVTAMTVYITGNLEHPITLVFAPIVVLWAITMLEFWKRKEQRIALEWGMAGFETAEQARPEYQGEFIPSPVDGSTILYYPASRKTSKARRATLVIMSMILVVVSCIAAVYAFRWYLVYGSSGTGSWGRTYGGVISSVVNAIQIQVLNAIYKKIAVALTDFENHRTSTEYEDSLVKKLFSFTFCNSYGGFIYLAFIGEPALGIECERSCMTLLSINLTIVFVIQIVVGNLTEVLIPYVKYLFRMRAERGSDPQQSHQDVEGTQAETGLYLEQYDPIMGTLMDYAELAVQFGYITLFVVAFPLAPFLALANNYVEFRSDAFKLLTQMRRPVPRGAEDIGSWQGVFTAITCIGVVTNSALVCLIYEDTAKYSLSTRLWMFVLLQWVAFSFMAGMSELVPDIPDDVTLQLQRTEFLSSKIIDRVPDATGDSMLEVDESALVNIKFVVSPIVSPGGKEKEKEKEKRKDLPAEGYDVDADSDADVEL